VTRRRPEKDRTRLMRGNDFTPQNDLFGTEPIRARHRAYVRLAAKVRAQGRANLGRYPKIADRMGNVWFRMVSRSR